MKEALEQIVQITSPQSLLEVLNLKKLSSSSLRTYKKEKTCHLLISQSVHVATSDHIHVSFAFLSAFFKKNNR